MKNNNLVIIRDTFKKHGEENEVTGLTVMIDGIIQQTFDKIKNTMGYNSYDEVLRDVIFEGINTILKKG